MKEFITQDSSPIFGSRGFPSDTIGAKLYLFNFILSMIKSSTLSIFATVSQKYSGCQMFQMKFFIQTTTF